VSRLAPTSATYRVASSHASACRDGRHTPPRDDHGTLLATCDRCGISRTVNESRPIPHLCVDCRTAERWTPAPSPGDALRGGAWVRRGLTLIWIPKVPETAPRCCDCGDPTRDRHAGVQRCRDCWKIAVHQAAQLRAALRQTRDAARAAERRLENEQRRKASAVRCTDCDVALTTRHRHVQRCRDCWKIATRAAAEQRASTASRAERTAPAFCPIDGCLLAFPDEPCPACLAASIAATEAA
jgi:hypothetical protein